MQAFMCLTGFLAAVSLVPALESTQSYAQTVLRGGFFGPLGAFNHDQCNNAMSYNVFFAQNQLPASGCFTVAWSLAVQMQFWFIFPLVLLLLRPQTPGIRHEYFGTFARLCPLCWGALTAIAVLDADCIRILSGHRKKVEGLWVLLICSNFIGCFVNKIGPNKDPAHPLSDSVRHAFAYIIIQGVLSPLLPATTLMLTTTQRPAAGVSALLAKFLSSAAFKWLADITYDIYLTHALVFLGIWYVLPPSSWFAPDQPQTFALVSCLVLGTCMLVAWVHNRCWAKLLGSFTTRYQAKSVQSAKKTPEGK
ncbi:g5196 [Coccomyxa elongata]